MKKVFKKKEGQASWNKALWKSSGYPETSEDALKEFDRSVNYFWNVSKIHKKSMRNALKELRRQENCYLLFQNMSNVGLQDLIFMMNSLEDQKKNLW